MCTFIQVSTERLFNRIYELNATTRLGFVKPDIQKPSKATNLPNQISLSNKTFVKCTAPDLQVYYCFFAVAFSKKLNKNKLLNSLTKYQSYLSSSALIVNNIRRKSLVVKYGSGSFNQGQKSLKIKKAPRCIRLSLTWNKVYEFNLRHNSDGGYVRESS